MAMTDQPHSPEEREHVLSERFLRELAEILERMWQPIRNGQSDLREWEQQIRGLARREVKAARQSAEAALLEKLQPLLVDEDSNLYDASGKPYGYDEEIEAENDLKAEIRTALNIPNGGNEL